MEKNPSWVFRALNDTSRHAWMPHYWLGETYIQYHVAFTRAYIRYAKYLIVPETMDKCLAIPKNIKELLKDGVDE